VVGIRDGAGQAIELTSFIDPIAIEGGRYFVSALERPGVAGPEYLRLPLDAAGTLDTYQRLIAVLNDPVRRDAIAARLTRNVDEDGARVVRESLEHGFDMLFSRGLAALGDESPTMAGATAQQADDARQALVALMSRAAVAAYLDLHPDANPRDAVRFAADSLIAYGAWLEAGRPPLVRVDALVPRSATVLQVMSSPGRFSVYLGMGMLTVGVALLVLLQERRAWIRRDPSTGDIVVALASNRPSTLLDAELRALVAQLEIDGSEWPLPNLLT
jgi:cytochrome c biogenesis protein